MIERSAVILSDGRLVRWRSGGAVHVDLDWKWVMKREETNGDVVGFFHTHPPGIPGMSGRDRRTMKAWASSFGRPLVCAIRCGRAARAWRCAKDGAVEEIGGVRMAKRRLAW